jgi:hypothetical protein
LPVEPYRHKKGDTQPPFRAQLVDADGLPQPIQSGDTLEFHMSPVVRGVTPTINKEAEIDDDFGVDAGLDGRVRYFFDVNDTPLTGLFDVEIQINFAGGGAKTFPNDGYYRIEIIGELA